ncbi:hypothetical protein MIND_00560500 [Mycena indigotica]|uniref:Uncharacterized protein n=1 Tax=Mycena indigotica TaxID=2126181 RepID=A0A8H6W7G3_9AGAR|nr:uncharacterized protein MIND_00560500 [Mycena indigotica]KAF7307652.1 hypothetical protein MIND_00560500 [Mycena indigotica]
MLRPIAPLPRRPSPVASSSNEFPKSKAKAKTNSILAYFSKETPAEKEVRLEREHREYAEKSERRKWEIQSQERVLLEEKRAKNAAYMKAYRAKLRDERIARGDIPKRGRKRKAAEAELLDNDLNGPNKRLPEFSRPFRQFAEEAREGNKPSGRKRLTKNIPTDAVRIRWQNPLIWQQFLLAVDRVRWPWRPCDIIREARKVNEPLFGRLREQVVGRWIDRKQTTQKGGIVWTEAVSKALALQSRSANSTSRVGILTPFPETRPHRDVVDEAIHQLASDCSPAKVRLDTTIGNLRNRSVQWVLQALKEISQPDLVKKAFEMCEVGDFNCSQESLTSPSTLAKLRRLSKEHPSLHAELTRATENDTPEIIAPTSTGVDEEIYSRETVYDDSDTPIEVAFTIVQGKTSSTTFVVGDDGGIQRDDDAETLELDVDDLVAEEPQELGRGRRRKTTNKLYSARLWEEGEI